MEPKRRWNMAMTEEWRKSEAFSKIISPGVAKDYDGFLDHIFVKMSGN